MLDLESPDLLPDLNMLASQWEVLSLVQRGQGMLAQAIDHDNVFSLLMFSNIYEFSNLHRAVVRYIMQFFYELRTERLPEGIIINFERLRIKYQAYLMNYLILSRKFKIKFPAKITIRITCLSGYFRSS